MSYSFACKGNSNHFKVKGRRDLCYTHLTKTEVTVEVAAHALALLHLEYWEFIRAITYQEPYALRRKIEDECAKAAAVVFAFTLR